MYVSEMTTITLQMIAITISAKIMMVITIIHRSLYQYMQGRPSYGCSGCTCTHSFSAPPQIVHISVPLFCPAPKLLSYMHPRYLVQLGASGDVIYGQPLSLYIYFILHSVNHIFFRLK